MCYLFRERVLLLSECERELANNLEHIDRPITLWLTVGFSRGPGTNRFSILDYVELNQTFDVDLFICILFILPGQAHESTSFQPF